MSEWRHEVRSKYVTAWVNDAMNECEHERMTSWMNGKLATKINDAINELQHKYIYEWMVARMSEGMNEQSNHWITACINGGIQV